MIVGWQWSATTDRLGGWGRWSFGVRRSGGCGWVDRLLVWCEQRLRLGRALTWGLLGERCWSFCSWSGRELASMAAVDLRSWLAGVVLVTGGEMAVGGFNQTGLEDNGEFYVLSFLPFSFYPNGLVGFALCFPPLPFFLPCGGLWLNRGVEVCKQVIWSFGVEEIEREWGVLQG